MSSLDLLVRKLGVLVLSYLWVSQHVRRLRNILPGSVTLVSGQRARMLLIIVWDTGLLLHRRRLRAMFKRYLLGMRFRIRLTPEARSLPDLL